MMKAMYSFLLIFFFIIISAISQAQQDDYSLSLWYEEPAKDWFEALPVGNGRMGAMVFGGFLRERIQLNEESLWGGSKTQADADVRAYLPKIQQLLIEDKIEDAVQMAEKYMVSDPLRIRSYQTLGDIFIDFKDGVLLKPYWRNRLKPENYQRSLSLEQGLSKTEYVIENVKITHEVFASAVDDIIAIHLKADKAGALTFRLSFNREQDATTTAISKDELLVNGQIIDLPGHMSGKVGLQMKFAARIYGKNKGGSLQTVNNSFFVQNADEATFYVTAATDYNFEMLNYDRSIDPAKRCDDILKTVRSKSYKDVKTTHQKEHFAMFGRVDLQITHDDNSYLPIDKRLKAVKEGGVDIGLSILQFQYGRYMLMASSRKPGIFPANLQGIWNEDYAAAWNADFHTNVNIQMNYWPAEVANLSETALPLSDLINALKVPGRETAKLTYNAKGWTMNHLSNPFGRTAISDGVGWGTFPMAGPWMVLHQWEHYLFTKDLDYLKNEAWPTMKESAEFVLSFMVKDPKTGLLVTAPSNSPENTYRLTNGKEYKFTYGATMDIQIIRELLKACLIGGNLLGEDNAFLKECRVTLKNLPETKIGKRYNTIQEWIKDYEEVEPEHRHISHLFGLYPGTQITVETPELFEAAKRTIERRMTASGGTNAYTGWSKAWTICFYARLFDAEAAWQASLDMQRNLFLPNLFDLIYTDKPPYQIDGNLGYVAGIAEMLLQSHTEKVELLPALPKAWNSGLIKGLKARGNFEVDIDWEQGELKAAEILSLKGENLIINYKGQTLKTKTKIGETIKVLFKDRKLRKSL